MAVVVGFGNASGFCQMIKRPHLHFRAMIDEAALRELLLGRAVRTIGHNSLLPAEAGDAASCTLAIILRDSPWIRQLRSAATDPPEAREFLPRRRRTRFNKAPQS